MGKGFDACKTPRSIYPSTFNHFPVIQPLIPKMVFFCHILVSREYAPGTIAVNVTWMERGFNAYKMRHIINPFTGIFNHF